MADAGATPLPGAGKMKRTDFTLSTALCLSLALHAGLSLLLIEQFTRDLRGRMPLPPITRAELPAPPPFQVHRLPPNPFGDADSEQGDAMHVAPGLEPMQAPEATQDQPLLSRDPVGPGDLADPPSRVDAAAAPARAAAQPQRLESLDADIIETRSPARFGMASSAAPTAVPSYVAPADLPVPDDVVADAALPDPAPMSESESDPFATRGTVEFRDGRVVARFGREVRTTRPSLTNAGQLSLLALNRPDVVMKVSTDSGGHVTSVEVLQSSGRNEIDHPVRIAMYNWWIEPPTDENGDPMPDVMVWRIQWR